MRYYRPNTLKKALKILETSDQPVAPLYFPPRAKHVMEWQPNALMDLSELAFNTIQFRKKEVIIGSMVSLETLAKSAEIQALWSGVLSEAARLSATSALRNLASIGGVLMNPCYPAEVTLFLLTANAEVLTADAAKSEKRIPIEEFLKDGKPTLKKGQLITGIAIPLHKRDRFTLERVARTKSDTSIVAVVAGAETTLKNARSLRIAIAGANPAPKRYPTEKCALLADQLTSEAIEKCAQAVAAETNPVSDYRGSAEYRTAMAVVLTRRALESLKKSKHQ